MSCVHFVSIVCKHNNLFNIAQVYHARVKLNNSIWLGDDHKFWVYRWDDIYDLLARNERNLVVQTLNKWHIITRKTIDNPVVLTKVFLDVIRAYQRVEVQRANLSMGVSWVLVSYLLRLFENVAKFSELLRWTADSPAHKRSKTIECRKWPGDRIGEVLDVRWALPAPGLDPELLVKVNENRKN